MFSLKQKAQASARRAGYLSISALLAVVGIGFLTLAGWIALSAVLSPLQTALVLAGLYLGLAALFAASGLRRTPHEDAPRPEPQPKGEAAEGAPLVQAFLYGLEAGSRAGAKKG